MVSGKTKTRKLRCFPPKPQASSEILTFVEVILADKPRHFQTSPDKTRQKKTQEKPRFTIRNRKTAQNTNTQKIERG